MLLSVELPALPFQSEFCDPRRGRRKSLISTDAGPLCYQDLFDVKGRRQSFSRVPMEVTDLSANNLPGFAAFHVLTSNTPPSSPEECLPPEFTDYDQDPDYSLSDGCTLAAIIADDHRRASADVVERLLMQISGPSSIDDDVAVAVTHAMNLETDSASPFIGNTTEYRRVSAAVVESLLDRISDEKSSLDTNIALEISWPEQTTVTSEEQPGLVPLITGTPPTPPSEPHSPWFREYGSDSDVQLLTDAVDPADDTYRTSQPFARYKERSHSGESQGSNSDDNNSNRHKCFHKWLKDLLDDRRNPVAARYEDERRGVFSVDFKLLAKLWSKERSWRRGCVSPKHVARNLRLGYRKGFLQQMKPADRALYIPRTSVYQFSSAFLLAQ